MTAFAFEDGVSSEPVQGGVEITDEQYEAAIAGMLDGKIVTVDGGFALIDPPEPPVPEPEPEPEIRATVLKSTVQARIIDKGKMDEAYAALTANPVYFARWFAPDRPVIYCDDPDAIGLVQAIGLDPKEILAPETE